MKSRLILGVLWSILTAVPASLFGAEDAKSVSLGGARSPSSFRSWTIKSDGEQDMTLSQFHVPIIAYVRAASNTDVVVSVAGASSRFKRDGESSSSLSGQSDLTLQAFFRTLENRLQVQAGTSFPTGTTGLDQEELRIARAISNPLLGFRLKQYGEGFDVSLGATYAFPLAGTTTLGIGAGFVSRGDYTLQLGGADYDPASEGALSAGLDSEVNWGSRQITWHFDGTVRVYGDDKVAGHEVFEEGTQLEFDLSGRAQGEGANGQATLRTVFKGDNTVFSQVGQVVESLKTSSGTSVLFLGSVDFPLSHKVRGGGELEFHRFTGSDTAGDDGTTFGLGPTAGFGFGRGWWGQTSLLLLLGSAEGDRNLSGFLLTFSISWREAS
jgi:hypothetical protein